MTWYDHRTPTPKETPKAPGGKGKAGKEDKRQEKQQLMTQPDPEDPLKANYGDLIMVQSQEQTDRKWTRVSDILPTLENQKVLIRGRVHTVRGKGKSAFLVLRQRGSTVQLVMFVNDQTISRGMVKYASQISKESIVDVVGLVTCPSSPVEGCTQKNAELQVEEIRVVSRANAVLPFELADASRSEEDIKAAEAKGESLATVTQDTRLDNRFLDLRTTANQAIFRIQSAVCSLFRNYLLKQDFVEIHTPKLQEGVSEGGAAVFNFQFFNTKGCLAQSPQLYKQQAIMADMQRVFEIGDVFRAELSFTHRHLCEFIGLDFEMEIKEHYFEVLDVVEGLFINIFKGIEEGCKKELLDVNSQYPFQPFLFQEKMLKLKFNEAVELLSKAGHKVEDDFTTEQEKTLGKIIKEKYQTDFYAIYNYPLKVRPFYTMPNAEDKSISNSFDVFMRGEEIISGAQRVHDPELLVKRAEEMGIPVNTLKSYIDAFKYGAPPHGGAGVGLERVVMLYLGLNNIRKTSMFPRDPKRLTP